MAQVDVQLAVGSKRGQDRGPVCAPAPMRLPPSTGAGAALWRIPRPKARPTRSDNPEFHVLARNEIRTYDALRGKKVSFNLKDSQTEVTADIIFNALMIDVQRANYDNDEAVKKLK